MGYHTFIIPKKSGGVRVISAPDETLKKKQRELLKDIQGELIGSGIEGNNEKLKDLDFYVFDIWDIAEQRYYDPITRKAILYALNNIVKGIPDNVSKLMIKHVLGFGFETLSKFKSLDELLAYAEGSSLNPRSRREGLVFKSFERINGEIISFKVLNNIYLLKQK